MSQSKIICLVFEGMGMSVLNNFFKLGYLDNLKQLLNKQGGELLSSKVPYEGPALQEAFTGYTAEECGVYSYWHIHNYDYTPKIIDSNDLVRKAIWQREDFSDKKFGVINIFGTAKPYKINGYMLSYLFQQSLHGCYPFTLLNDLSKEGLPYGNDVSAFYTGKPRDHFLNMILKLEKQRIDVALDLVKKVDVLIANFTAVDRVSHFYTQELDDGVFDDIKETAIFKAYELLDSALGKFMKELDKDSNLLVFSDLGFGTLREFVSYNDYLEKGGFLERDSDEQTNWSKTVAFEAIQGSNGFNINLEGLYRDGSVSLNDFEMVRNKVMNYLENLLNPKTGYPFFKKVCKGEEFYAGTYSKNAPHIMTVPYDERYLHFGDEYWAKHVTRHYQSGWHRRDGFWTGKGDKIDGIKKSGNIVDICSTLYDIAGKEIPNDLMGTSLLT